MSRAYICDRCGTILPADGHCHPIWTLNPIVFSDVWGDADMHLCDRCFEEFEREFKKNLREEG